MSESNDPENYAGQSLHRFWFSVATEKQWYDIIRECRAWFGKNWRGMGKVRRKLQPRYAGTGRERVMVWFEVPDPRFATWISVKYSIQAQSDAKYQSGK